MLCVREDGGAGRPTAALCSQPVILSPPDKPTSVTCAVCNFTPATRQFGAQVKRTPHAAPSLTFGNSEAHRGMQCDASGDGKTRTGGGPRRHPDITEGSHWCCGVALRRKGDTPQRQSDGANHGNLLKETQEINECTRVL